MAERAAAGCSPVPETLVRPPDRFVAGEESALVGWHPSRSVPADVPPGQGRSAAHRAPRRPGAQRRDPGPRGHDRPHRPRGLPGPRGGRGPGHLARHGLGRGGARRGGRDRPGHAARGDRGAGHAERADPRRSSSAATAARGSGRPTSRRPMPPCRCGPSGRPPGSASSSCSARTAAASPSPPASPATWPSRAPASAAPASTGCPRSRTTWRAWPGDRSTPALVERLGRRLAEVNGRGACRHPDGAVTLVRSALTVFADDVRSHLRGAPCPHWNRPTVLRFPRLLEVA